MAAMAFVGAASAGAGCVSFAGARGKCAVGASARAHSVNSRRVLIKCSSAEDDKKAAPEQKKDSFIKLAMRNMVYQAPKSVQHFGLTFVALMTFFVGVALITK